jgi:hypothetical protein
MIKKEKATLSRDILESIEAGCRVPIVNIIKSWLRTSSRPLKVTLATRYFDAAPRYYIIYCIVGSLTAVLKSHRYHLIKQRIRGSWPPSVVAISFSGGRIHAYFPFCIGIHSIRYEKI